MKMGGKKMMALGSAMAGTNSLTLCSQSIPNGNYVLYVQAVGKPSIANQISGPVKFTPTCGGGSAGNTPLTFGTDPTSLTIASGASGRVTVTAASESRAFQGGIGLTFSS